MSSEPKSPNAYGVLYDVNDLEALRKALKFNQIDILGYSYGGFVALIYGLIYPGRVRHLIVCSTPIGETNEEIEKRIAVHPLSKAEKKAKSPEEIKKIYYQFYFRKPPDSKVRYYNELARLAYVTTKKSRRLIKGYEKDETVLGKLLGLLDWRKCIQQIRRPVLLINGKYDPIVSIKVTKRLASGVNNARFVLFKESSHDPFVDETVRFERVINGFLSST